MARNDPKPMPISVGFQWRHNESGKVWVVTGLRPGGVCEIHRVGRHVWGDMYSRDIRASIESGAATRVDLSDEARAILRRCNA